MMKAFGVHVQLNGGFAHRRLSILDLSSAGHQPMIDKSGRWVITLNGELYNFKYLKSVLEKSFGTKFIGTSDTEVALEYVAAYGVRKALADFKGMFAFGLLDLKERKLFLARDRAGEKPLFYYLDQNEIAFSSELPSLLKMVSSSPRISRESLGQFLRFNFIPAPNSIYEQIKKIPPAGLLEINFEKGVAAQEIELYWNAETEFTRRAASKRIIPYEEQLKEFDLLFTEAVRGQLQADVPVGAFSFRRH
jgi:asparagine synthase (glutamine-hydrolysing)